MAGIPRKTSGRGAPGSAQSQRGAAPKPAPASQRAPAQRPSASQRVPAVPEPVIYEEEEQLILDEPLDLAPEAPPPPKPKASADAKVFSESSLYSDEDPLDKMRQQKKSGVQKPAKPQVRPSGVQPKVESNRTSAKGSGLAPKVETQRPSARTSGVQPSARPSGIHNKADVGKSSGRLAPQKPGTSNRQPAIKASGRRPAVQIEEEEQDIVEEAPVSTRTSGRMSARRSAASAPASAGISLKTKILAGVVVVAVLVVAIGYKPFMKSMHIKTLDDPAASADARSSAAKALFANYNEAAFMIFAERVDSSDAALRDAAAEGLVEYGKLDHSRDNVIDKFAAVLPNAEKDAKKTYLTSIETVAKAARESKNGDAKAEAAQFKKLAGILTPVAEAGEFEHRKIAMTALRELRVPGVCKMFIKIAAAEKLELRNMALNSLSYTALPDAAGDLLKAMAGADKDLAAAAKKAFVAIRDQAPSKDLVDLVADPVDDVRREIVDALGKRQKDADAARGIARALKDKLPDIRVLAVKAVPVTGMSGSMSQLGELVRDSDENVRVATGETLGKLGDPDSYKILLEAFKDNLQGRTMETFIKSLGKRSSSGKDLKAIAIVMPLFNSNPAAEASIREAMVLLTLAGTGPKREQERRVWDKAKWQSWYANILAREKMRTDLVSKLDAMNKRKDDDRNKFPGYFKQAEALLDEFEKCKEMCKPDDPEDSGMFAADMKRCSILKEYFMKGSSFDMRK